MKTSTIVIAIIGIAIIGYLVYKYVYLPHKTSTSTTTTSITAPSTVSISQYIPPSSSSTSSTSSTSKSSSLTSIAQNYYTPPSSDVYVPPKTIQIAYAQELACQRFPQLCAKEAPYLFNFKGPVTAYSPTQSSSSSSVHQSNPSTISQGKGKYVRPAGGVSYLKW